MNRYLLDTNHASALWRGHPALVSRIRAEDDAEFSLCLPSIGELWFMVHNSARVTENQASLRQFLLRFNILPYDAHAAEQFGQIKSHLRRLGRPIPAIDAQIAAIARAQETTLLTADAHFQFIPSMKHANWL